jgi:hypothetical protein
MMTVPHNPDNRMNVDWFLQVVRNRFILLISFATMVILLFSPTVVSQSVLAQSGLRVIAHVFSEPFDRTYVELYDDDGDYFNSKIITTRSDGTRNVEFRVPQGDISVYEDFFVYGESDSSNCGDARGYNSPASTPEHVYLDLGPCDLP